MRNRNKKRADMRRWLNRYRILKKEIQAREKHIQVFIVDMYNPLMTNPISDMPKGKGLVSDLTYSTVERIEQQYSRMLVEMQNSVDDLVAANDGEWRKVARCGKLAQK